MLYESVFVFSGQLSPKVAEDKFNEILEQIKNSGGKILKKESWGLRSLAYKIKKNSKGYYFMINSDSESAALNDFNQKIKQDDEFLRFLNIKIKEVDKELSYLDESKSKERTRRKIKLLIIHLEFY